MLYLSVEGYDGSAPAPHANASPEGHGIEYDESGRVIAMTLVNVKWLLERDGELTITWPAGHIGAGDLADALTSAA